MGIFDFLQGGAVGTAANVYQTHRQAEREKQAREAARVRTEKNVDTAVKIVSTVGVAILGRMLSGNSDNR